MNVTQYTSFRSTKIWDVSFLAKLHKHPCPQLATCIHCQAATCTPSDLQWKSVLAKLLCFLAAVALWWGIRDRPGESTPSQQWENGGAAHCIHTEGDYAGKYRTFNTFYSRTSRERQKQRHLLPHFYLLVVISGCALQLAQSISEFLPLNSRCCQLCSVAMVIQPVGPTFFGGQCQFHINNPIPDDICLLLGPRTSFTHCMCVQKIHTGKMAYAFNGTGSRILYDTFWCWWSKLAAQWLGPSPPWPLWTQRPAPPHYSTCLAVSCHEHRA